jgi:hypothetical protein
VVELTVLAEKAEGLRLPENTTLAGIHCMDRSSMVNGGGEQNVGTVDKRFSLSLPPKHKEAMRVC